jgi:hypothetical protein
MFSFCDLNYNYMNAKEYLESNGYEFSDKDFWMEDYVTDHKFKDLVQLMEDYAQQKLNIAGISGSDNSAVDTKPARGYCECKFVMIMRDQETDKAYCSRCKKEVNEQ